MPVRVTTIRPRCTEEPWEPLPGETDLSNRPDDGVCYWIQAQAELEITMPNKWKILQTIETSGLHGVDQSIGSWPTEVYEDEKSMLHDMLVELGMPDGINSEGIEVLPWE